MKKLGLFILFFIAMHVANAQRIKPVSVNWVDEMRAKTNDTLYVINFWATWCKPCVEELPYFQTLAKNYEGKKVKVILVTTDMRKDIATRVTDFVKSKGITMQVVYINEVNADKWINKVNTDWTGAIPATWFLKGSEKVEQFHEGEFTYEELDGVVKPLVH